MAELWDNVSNALISIKDVIFGFYDIVKFIFSFVPSPFSDILSIAFIIIIAISVVKIVRG